MYERIHRDIYICKHLRKLSYFVLKLHPPSNEFCTLCKYKSNTIYADSVSESEVQ